jgi:hypothetical protein
MASGITWSIIVPALGRLQEVVVFFAQFLAVCSASTLAEELRIFSPFSSQSRESREAALRDMRIHIYQLQPTTRSDKLSEKEVVYL